MSDHPSDVLGREAELRRLSDFLETLRGGSSGTLVVYGDPGIGKTTVLGRFIAEASRVRVEACSAVESEMELSWAGLHQLCLPMLASADRLPGPLRTALQIAFGLVEGDEPDPFRVGLGVLGLFTEVATREPLICIVDDVHALDVASARTLAFVGRRLQSESVGLIFGTREIAPDLAGFPSLRIPALAPSDARRLLDEMTFSPLDPEVRNRILAEAGGNPLAIVELGSQRYVEQLAGGYEVPATVDVRDRIEQRFLQSAAELPDEHRRLLLLAASEPTGDPGVLNRAAVAAGLQVPGPEHPALGGLISFVPRVRFRHPLVRSAIYGAATEAERRSAHRALAMATHGDADPDRQIWHLARSLNQADDAVAQRLVQSAARARVRGGFPGAAAFLERAAELTTDPLARARRELDAAAIRIETGEPDAAVRLLNAAEARSDDDLLGAEAALMRGGIALNWGNIDRSPALLLRAAERLGSHDAARARAALFQAVVASGWSAPLGSREGRQAVITAARNDLERRSDAEGSADLLTTAFLRLAVDGVAAATAPTRAGTRALLDGLGSADTALGSLTTAVNLAMGTFDVEGATALAECQVDRARQLGAVRMLPTASEQLAAARFLRGDVRGAEVLAAEAVSVDGAERLCAPELVLAAWRGDDARHDALASTFRDAGHALGLGHVILWVDITWAVRHNSRGDHRAALEALARVVDAEIPVYASLMACEYAEAAGRAGTPEEVGRALDHLMSLTSAADTGWSRGVRAIAAALLGGLGADDRERAYRDGIREFREVGMVVFVARVQLLLGEWLAGMGRERESRIELTQAHEGLSGLGFEPFARRAAKGLGATGRTRRRTPTQHDSLTHQERQVAEMAAAGLNNREIGERLFLSHRTVASHLYRIYPKLGIKSRNQLHLVLSDGAATGRGGRESPRG